MNLLYRNLCLLSTITIARTMELEYNFKQLYMFLGRFTNWKSRETDVTKCGSPDEEDFANEGMKNVK